MKYLLVGNIVAFMASILMIYSGMLKEKKKILYYQTLQIILFAISDLILGGITGAIINLISIVRNILCYKEKLGFKQRIIITFLATFFTVKYNNLGFLGLLPLISIVAYIWLMNIKSVKKFKLLIIFTTLLWLIYDILIKSYTAAVFDFGSICVNLVTFLQIKNRLTVIK